MAKKSRIEVLHYYNIFSAATWGGVQEHIATLAKHMRPQVTSSVLVSQESGTPGREDFHGLQVYRAGPARGPRGLVSTAAEWTVREFEREKNKLALLSKIPHDVLHVHGPLSFSGSVFGGAFFSALFSKQAWANDKKPVVSTFHGLPEVVLPLKYSDSPARHLFYGWCKVTQKNVARSQKVICVDRYVIDELSKRPGIDRKKLVFIPNGVDLSIFRPMGKDAARKIIRKGKTGKLFGKDWDGMPVFLYFNRLSREKGIHDIIALSKEIKKEKFRFVIAGDGPYSAEVAKLCGRDRRFFSFGPAGSGQAALLMNAADFLFTPLHHPGATRTNIEAVACGTPVITSRLGDRYPVVEGRTGFYYDDPAGLARLASKAAKGDLDVRGFASNSRKIIGQFDAQQVARKVTDIYRSVI